MPEIPGLSPALGSFDNIQEQNSHFIFFFKPMSSPGMAKELGILGDFQEERGSLIAGGAG